MRRLVGWVWGSFGIAVAGCSSADQASDASDELTGDTGSPEGPGSSGGSDPSGVDSDGATAADTTGSAGDTAPSDEGSGDGVGTDCAMDCGDGGSCSLDAADVPMCVCDEGFANNGMTCVPCVDAPSGIDLSMSIVHLRITLNGATPPASAAEYGNITLRHRDTGDIVPLGDTRTPELTASVIAGTYDVFYAHVTGAAVVPANAHARLGQLVALEDVDQTFDIPVVSIEGAFSYDGAPAPSSDAENGRVFLSAPAWDDEILLGSTKHGSYSVMVIPGDYEMVFEAVTGGEIAPANAHGTFGVLSAKSADAPLDIDIPTVQMSGQFSFDALPAPQSAAEYGRVSLSSGTDSIFLGETRSGDYTVRVLPGSYDVVYEAVVGAEVAPANRRAVLSNVIAARSVMNFDVDVPTVVLDGGLTFNGEPTPNDPTDDGYVMLRHPNGDEVLLGMTSSGDYSRRVVAGTYDLYYVQDSSRAAAPRNTNARLGDLDANASASRDIDIPRVDLSGSITLAGQTPPDSDYQDGHIFLRDMVTGDSVLLGNTRAAVFSAPVVPGAYEVVYVAETAGAPLPVNTGSVIDDVVVDAGMPVELAIDVPARSLAGPVTINGEPAPMNSQDVGNLYLVDAQTRDQIYLGTTYDGAYAQTLTPGNYLVFYRVAISSGAVPANANANLGCWTLQ